jgi:hypothetical protein
MEPDNTVCRCPVCEKATPITPREMQGLVETQMRVVCSGCKKPSLAKDWMPKDE